nr:mRNA capping enzyme [Mimivirus sp.]
MYADLLWKLCVYDQLTPYKLDGIIYTPINTPYMIKASPGELDSIPMEYKWKPPAQNSIDFYIKFNKDAMGAEAIYYDNSVVRGEGKPYKICGLYVGLIKSGQELPIPFKVSGIEQKANIYLTNDEALDIEGNVITDNTVVEFVYDNLKKIWKKRISGYQLELDMIKQNLCKNMEKNMVIILILPLEFGEL